VPPGISDATVAQPGFNLTPAATVDEGNNWINISWGPLSQVSPTNVTLGNYALAAGFASHQGGITPVQAHYDYNEAPPTDFFGLRGETDPSTLARLSHGWYYFSAADAHLDRSFRHAHKAPPAR